jgi:hypothetical protein
MTTYSCPTSVSGESEAAKLLKLLRMVGVKDAEIDRGVQRSDFTRNKSAAVTVRGTAGDGKLEPNEIYGAAIRKLEEEEDRFVASGGKSQRTFTDLVSTCSTFRVPWLFNDFDKATTLDDQTLFRIVRTIATIKKSITGLRLNTYSYNHALVTKLVTWMESSLKRVSLASAERTNLEMAAGKDGDCTELSRFAHAVLRLAGFKPEFLIITENAINPNNPYHIAVGVPLDPGKRNELTQIDLYYKYFLKKGLSHPGRIIASRQTMLAVGEITEARNISAKQTLIARTIARYKHALQFDEYYPDAYYNMARALYKHAHRIVSAKILNKRALELRPDMKEALQLKRIMDNHR